MSEDIVYIYGLRDPLDKKFYYIGKTINPEDRFRQHLRCNGDNERKDAWVQSLLESRQEPEMVILETTIEREWSACERGWIRDGLKSQWPLLNIAEGGQGHTSGHNFDFIRKYLTPEDKAVFNDGPHDAKVAMCCDIAKLCINDLRILVKDVVVVGLPAQECLSLSELAIETLLDLLENGNESIRLKIAKYLVKTTTNIT